MEKDFKQQWPAVDMDLFKEFIQIHNQVCCEKKTQKDFNEFVLKNKEKFNNPDYLQIFAQNLRIEQKFFKENKDVCQLFYDFMKNNPDWTRLAFSLSTSIVLEMFNDSFEEFLKENK